MSSDNNVVDQTLSLLDNLGLPYPGGPLLASFVTEALNPVQAANYLHDRLSAGESSSLVSDWTYIIQCVTGGGCPPPQPDRSAQTAITRRDGFKCCVTGKKGTFWDPLLVLPILPIPSGWDTEEGQIFEMLGAFFGPQYRDWWLFYIRNPDHMGPYPNHWLIRRSVADVFARGFVKLDRLQPSPIEYEVGHVLMGPEEPISIDGVYALLGDHSRSGTQKIDPRFVGTHARLCRSIRYLEITKRLAADQTPHSSSPSIWRFASHFFSRSQGLLLRGSFSISNHIRMAFVAVWLIFPARFRIAGYNVLRRLGEHLYGKPNSYSTVQRLPFGLYLKYNGEPNAFRNEFNALRVVRKHTSIPVPYSHDLVIKPGNRDDPFSSPEALLLITRLPGLPLSRCLDVLSDRDCELICSQMKDYLSQLREIPKAINPEMAICNTVGEACQDPRIYGGQPVGPFQDEAGFSQVLRYSDEPARRGHKIVFTHADLNPRNILVDRVTRSDGSRGWTVTGIVDWETAGYYPEYWDYTKSRFEEFRAAFWRYSNIMKEAIADFGDYSQEYAIEKKSWESGDGV